MGQLQHPAGRVHRHQHIAPIPQRGQDVCHQLFVAQAPLGLHIGGVVGVGDEQAGPGQAVNVTPVQMPLLQNTMFPN